MLGDELDGARADVADRLRRGAPRPRPSAARAGVMPARASSTTFWWRRCSEQSRSNR